MNLKCNLKWLIPKSGKNQNEIADQMGISKQMFSNWVSGRNYMRIDKAYKLAKILGVKVDALYDEIDTTSNATFYNEIDNSDTSKKTDF